MSFPKTFFLPSRFSRKAGIEGHLSEVQQYSDHVRERHLLERELCLHVRVQRRLAGQAPLFAELPNLDEYQHLTSAAVA